jgi:4-diphosphocytidyl-2-C-methyl-D-erythritol kinase
MTLYRLLAPAKINLHLEILGLRSDGFHELAMIMQSVALADVVEVEGRSDKEIRLHCNRPEIPQDRSNLAYRAAELMQQRFPKRAQGVNITLEKHIPMAAGLAGGSGNAAAVIVGLDLLWELGATQGELQEIGAELGSDVPFCISGGTAIATGRGEMIDTLLPLQTGAVVLGKYRSLEVSTPWAYRSYREQFGHLYPTDLVSQPAHSHAQKLVQAIANQDLPQVAQQLTNDLEKVVLPAYPLVQELRQVFGAIDSLGVMMSGSGPTVFAIAQDLAHAEAIAAQVRHQLPSPDLELFAVGFSDRGIHLAS